MTRSKCWSKKETPKKSNSYRIAWTHISIPALREVDLELSARRGTNKSRAVVSLYWSSRGLHLKYSSNQISCKSTKVGPIRMSRTWKKTWTNSKFYALQHIKPNFPKTTKVTNAGVISVVVTPKLKTGKPPCKTKSQDLIKICGDFLVFPSVI